MESGDVVKLVASLLGAASPLVAVVVFFLKRVVTSLDKLTDAVQSDISDRRVAHEREAAFQDRIEGRQKAVLGKIENSCPVDAVTARDLSEYLRLKRGGGAAPEGS